MKISVVIPVYNVEKYIRQCLDSIVAQTLGIDNIEVIIVNDASPDNSLEIIEEFKEKYPDSFKIINNKTNIGPGETRNLGLKQVSSDYVTCIDSDDFISENTLKDCLEKISENNCDLLIYNWISYCEDGSEEPPSLHRYEIKEDEIIEDISQKKELIFSTSTCNKIYHKKLLKHLIYPKGIYEDNSVALKVMFNSKRIYLNSQNTYYYRKNPDSITENIAIKNSRDLSNSINKLSRLASDYPQYKNLINLLIIKFISDVLFWIYYYDWYSFEEIEMVDNLKNSHFNIEKADLERFFNLYPNYEPNYFEDILDINKLDSDTFIAKYKYYKPLAKISPIANLYIDTGRGFNERDKISKSYTLSDINRLTFNLEKFKNIRQLRFDPIEGAFIKAKIITDLDISGGNFENSLDDDFQIFTNLDPSYILKPAGNNLEIEFKLAILNDNELVDLFNNKNNIINELKNKPKKGFLKRLR